MLHQKLAGKLSSFATQRNLAPSILYCCSVGLATASGGSEISSLSSLPNSLSGLARPGLEPGSNRHMMCTIVHIIVRKIAQARHLHPPVSQPMAPHSGASWSFEHSARGHHPHSAPLPTGLAAHGKLMADASRCDRQRSPSDLCPGICRAQELLLCVLSHLFFYIPTK